MSNQKKRLEEYRKARNDGIKLACKIILDSEEMTEEEKNKALKAIGKEQRFRKNNNMDTNLTLKELEEASETMRILINEGQILIALSVLHDEFDFGRTRLNRYMDRFCSIHDSIQGGWAGYSDYRDMLAEKMGKLLPTDLLSTDPHWEKDEKK